jgi:hypothetical protein
MGSSGNAGTSVSTAVEPPGANCANGGSRFTVDGTTTYACNGAAGSSGTGAFASEVTRTGAIAPNTSTWTTIPGLSVTFSLAHSSLVQFTGNGTQRTTDSNASTFCHVGYRYVVDGDARGDAMWGQRIQVNNGAYEWHSIWTVIDSAVLGAGSHTVAVQAINPSPNGSCYVCAEGDGTQAAYDACTLRVQAVPQ